MTTKSNLFNFQVEVGIGTTTGGFQIQPLTVFYKMISAIVVSFQAKHGNQVYVTAIAQNHAGMRSVFHSAPIIVDHTPPEITNVDVDLLVANATEINGVAVVLTASWTIEDESEVKFCTCDIGK